jgi:hypothetical protein
MCRASVCRLAALHFRKCQKAALAALRLPLTDPMADAADQRALLRVTVYTFKIEQFADDEDESEKTAK